MESFKNQLAVVTGGGAGMGRELVVQLAAEGCSVATCDVNEEALAETAARATDAAPLGTMVSTHVCDVGDEASVERFRDAVITQHQTDHIDLLFNNAGIDGFISFVNGERTLWERTFGVCWGGVYYCSRAFLPLLVASDDAYLVNTSSINGFRASHPHVANTAYCTAKFAVKGFSEALIEDLRLHAPNVKVAVVMPGAIVTDLGANSSRILGRRVDVSPEDEEAAMRSRLAEWGIEAGDLGAPTLRAMIDAFKELFYTPASEASRMILGELRTGSWRILIGDDAHELDRAVRANPEDAYMWDGPSIADKDAVVSVLQLVRYFDPESAKGLAGKYAVRLGRRMVSVNVQDGQLDVRRGVVSDPIAAIECEPAVFRRLIEKRDDLDNAIERGVVRLTGSRLSVDRLLTAVASPDTRGVDADQVVLSAPAGLPEPEILDSSAGKLAVVTGGGTGIGRELVVQLAAEGCSVALCDVNEETMAQTAAHATAVAPAGTIVSTHVCDVADERSVGRLRDEVVTQHQTDHVDLLFNNAGIVASNSFVAGDRASWERVFDVCWGGVYNCSRAFLPLLIASERAWLVNTSSIQGFWVDGPGWPCTAYAAAKFAVKGFSEALIEDFRLNAPHVNVAVVLPGQIVTELGANSARVLGRAEREIDPTHIRTVFVRTGLLPDFATDEDVRRAREVQGGVAEFLMTSPVAAARSILDGVYTGRWRVLVGDDAHRLDQAVRADPGAAYDVDSEISAIFYGWLFPMVVLRAFFDPARVMGWSARVELRDGDERIALEVVDGKLQIAHGGLSSSDATLETDPRTFHQLLVGTTSLDDATEHHKSRLTGDRKVVERLLEAIAMEGRSMATSPPVAAQASSPT